jgi:signal transduction histidine kinase
VGSPSPRQGSAAPAETLRKLAAVTDAALAHLSLDELLDALLTRVRDVLEADTCAVLLLDDTRGELVARAAKGLEEEVERRVRIPVGRGFAGRVMEERAPVVIPDVAQAEIVNPILRERGIKSLLGVPLLVNDRPLGVLHVGSLTERTFTEEDVNLLQVVAERAAHAIDHGLMYDELVRLTQIQREFVALAAHELRTPATIVYGLAATLHERADELQAETVVELRETLHQQADRMRRLVEQLLDLSRLETAAVEVAPRRIKLRPQIEGIVDAVAPGRPDAVAVDIPADLEATVDPTAVERVIGNLVVNALKHGEPPVRVSAQHRDRHLRIAVEDEGAGVAEDFVPFLFDRFRRSDRTRALSSSGAGLGLAIARAYARAHGGDLFYTPNRPAGARFELVLPRIPA